MPTRAASYLTRAVPRYTSYPTVPHFTPDIGAVDYGGWLERLDPTEPISLYLHVPFCRQACWYCGCNMKLAVRDEPVADYAGTLMREISLVAARLPGRFKLSHLHWGGGTPTALVPDDLECAMEVVRTHFDFTADAEIAIESDPRTLTADMTARIGALGFNRASFGVQEFDPKVQTAINRVQPPDMVRAAVDGLRGAGVRAINFDLIYGLPHQSVENLRNTVDLCAEMVPDRLALFGYAHVPWMAKKQRLIPTEALPGADERLAQASAAAKALADHGYAAIGLDHFALESDPLSKAAHDGTLRRNFQGYTTDTATTLLGVGATSIGRTPGGFVQNVAETGAWARAVNAGDFPIAKGHAFRGEDALRSAVIEALMCQGKADLAVLGAAHAAGRGWDNQARKALDPLIADGLAALDGDTLTLTEMGKPLARVVAACFDSYLAPQADRHSVAV